MELDNTLATNNPKRLYSFMILAGIILIAINLRPGMTSVGPLMGIIRDDVGLANWSVGLLTALPLLAFSFVSPLVPILSKRYSNEVTMIIGLTVLMFGISIRSLSMISFLFIGTIFVGLGIAICNVLLPAVVKENYPQKAALMTSVYSTIMAIFAATASGLSIPFAIGLDLGWQVALFLWSIPIVFALIVWIYLARKRSATEDLIEGKMGAPVQFKNEEIWKSTLAWQVAFFMGLQATMFFVIVSWLPEILLDYGVSISTAGWMLSYTLTIGLPASFFVPVLADRLKNQKGIVLFLGSLAIVGFSGLLFGNSFFVLMISASLLGIVMNGNFSLALTFLAIRAENGRQASELSGMSQSIGYLLAAIGPVMIGYLFDLTKSWTAPLLTLMGIAVLIVLVGLRAGEDKFIYED